MSRLASISVLLTRLREYLWTTPSLIRSAIVFSLVLRRSAALACVIRSIGSERAIGAPAFTVPLD